MKLNPRILWASLLLVSILLNANISTALLSDKKHGRWNLIGKFKTEATFRTVDTPDNNPIPIKAGDLVTQRNLLFIDFKHDLGDVLPWLNLGYFLQGRFFYDSAWDVGPDVLKDEATRRYYLFDNRDQINDLKWDADLYQGYLDVSSGPLFLRVGRQIVSWGEMSTKRILDGTNPLNTSSLAVDMLERLIPLAMVRANLAFGDVGVFSSIGLEGYYVPGCIENANGEEIIDGSPIIPPIGRNTQAELRDPFSMSSLMQFVEQVPDDIDSDRYGIKLNMMFGDLELNLVHYRPYSDIPVPYLDINAFDPIYLTWADIFSFDISNPLGSILGDQKIPVLLKLDKIDVYGASFNYYLGMIDTVFRGEVALFKHVPKITPGSIGDLISGLSSKTFLPGGNLSIGDIISGIDFGDLGGMTLPFSSGSIATFDVWKYGIAIDKNIVTPLNPKKEIMLMLEYVGSKIVGYKENTIMYPWQGPNGEILYEPEYTHDFILIARTEYLNGLLIPQLVTFYEVVPQAFVFIPSVTITKGSWAFKCTYFHTIADTYHQEGFLESRNEFSISFAYTF